MTAPSRRLSSTHRWVWRSTATGGVVAVADEGNDLVRVVTQGSSKQ